MSMKIVSATLENGQIDRDGSRLQIAYVKILIEASP